MTRRRCRWKPFWGPLMQRHYSRTLQREQLGLRRPEKMFQRGVFLLRRPNGLSNGASFCSDAPNGLSNEASFCSDAPNGLSNGASFCSDTPNGLSNGASFCSDALVIQSFTIGGPSFAFKIPSYSSFSVSTGLIVAARQLCHETAATEMTSTPRPVSPKSHQSRGAGAAKFSSQRVISR